MTKQKILWYAAAAFAVLGTVCRGVSGMRFSAALGWGVCLVLVLYAVLDLAAAKSRAAKWCRNALFALLCAGLAFFLVLEAMVVSGSRGAQDGAQDVSCVIILGAGVHGTVPSMTLRTRLDAALDYLADKPGLPVICSGGQGGGENISEAECMARYLLQRGIPEERIIREDRSTSTRTNFEYSRALMEERGIDTAKPFAYVTSDYHVYRAGRIAGRADAVGVSSRLPDGAYYSALELNYFVREAFALANELLFGVDL